SPNTGRVSLAPNLALPSDQPLAVLLADRLGCPVALENDVNIAALGEARIRPAAPSLAFISFGTGVGLGALVNGRLLRGATGAAGEIGFLPFGAEPKAVQSLETGALECAIG
ncbi:ROK family protein, partial [Mycobacterium tuberculosis]|nr:ROK family protein [Mycobacterium tuberculosis]